MAYFGIFLSSIVGNAIINMPWYVTIIAAAHYLDPIILSLVTAIGATIGNLFPYVLGFSGGKVGDKILEQIKNGKKKWWHKHARTFKRWFESNGFLTLLIFAATPLPDNALSFLSGYMEYKKIRFFLATLIGKTIMSFIIVYTSRFGINILNGFF